MVCVSLVTPTGAFATLKEKFSRINARIFPNPMGSSFFSLDTTKWLCFKAQSLLSLFLFVNLRLAVASVSDLKS